MGALYYFGDEGHLQKAPSLERKILYLTEATAVAIINFKSNKQTT